MPIVDRLPSAVWPEEKNVGGIHRTVRYVLGPVLLGVGVAVLVDLVPMAPGPARLVTGAGLLFAGAITLVEAHTQKCPGYAAMGINTCQLPDYADEAGRDGAARPGAPQEPSWPPR